ncbi:MAG: hypothetical protein ACJ74Q_15380 [Pyrinomonadaceae bacterium]
MRSEHGDGGAVVNPFEYEAPSGYGMKYLQAIDAQSRIDMLKKFDEAQLRAAIALPGVQKSVRTKAESLLKKMTKK